jgi:hypothetical protein
MTDELLKEAMDVDFQRTSDLFDMFRFGMIDRDMLEDGCREIISGSKFLKSERYIKYRVWREDIRKREEEFKKKRGQNEG